MTWNIETLRTACDKIYCRDYRYNDGARSTLLDFVCDIEADDTIADTPFDDDSLIQPEYLRRFIRGARNKQTGEWIFTVPRPDRLDRIVSFVREKNLLTEVALRPHEAPRSSLSSTRNALSGFANQSLLSGSFRGEYFGATYFDHKIINTVLICNFIAEECAFRIREISVEYRRRRGETDLFLADRSNTADWDHCAIRDGFAALGAARGVIAIPTHGNGKADRLLIGKYDWDRKNHRLTGFQMKPANIKSVGIDFKRCDQPQEINLSLQILQNLQ